MISDRDIALDVLTGMKTDCADCYKSALESSNMELRQALLQFAQDGAQSQLQFGQLATQKGWYLPAAPANPNIVSQTAQFFQGALSQSAR